MRANRTNALSLALNSLVTPEKQKTLLLLGYTALRIPMIAFLSPRLVKDSEDLFEIEIPLTFRSKNHWGSMYFGALAAGADLALGFKAFLEIKKKGARMAPLFKSFKADFVRRAEDDVVFEFTAIDQLREMIDEAMLTSERVSRKFLVSAREKVSSQTVAHFELELSLKNKSS